MPGADVPRELVVTGRTTVADDVVELVLASPDGRALPAWDPGAHLTLHLPDGGQRQYSLCGADPSGGSWTIAVHRAPDSRGGSRFVHDQLATGTRATVSGPANNFPLAADDRRVFVAGGIGITPILAMARAIRAKGDAVTMLYCGRSRSLLAYRDEIAAWAEPGVVLHADDEQGGPPDLSAFLDEHAGATIYCCGPEPLIAAVEKKAPTGSAVRVERFRGVEADTSADREFDVIVSGADQRVRVRVGESILDALAQAGFDVPSSCREGICGTCETAVVRGEPDHRDTVLGDEERAAGELIMPCVSRSRTPEIELDLF